MFRNYFYLNRFVTEANDILRNYKLTSIFTQEKDRLLLEFKFGTDEKYIELSVNPGFPFITLKRSYHRAKKNTIDFFNDDNSGILPSTLLSFEIAGTDRIIKINTEKLTLFFAIRGKYTNVFFIRKDSSVVLFKKNEEDAAYNFLKEAERNIYISFFNNPAFENKYNTWDAVKADYPILGKEVIAEAKTRSTSDEPDMELLSGIIDEIKNNSPAVFINEMTSEIRIAPETFRIFSYTTKIPYDNYLQAQSYFLSKYYQAEASDHKKRIIKKHLDRELYKLASKLNNLKNRVDNGSRENEYNVIGNLLLINRHLIQRGSNLIEVENIYDDNKPVAIKLNETLSPQKNIDFYFDKSRSEKINYDKSKQLYSSVIKEYNRLKETEARYLNLPSPDELDKIMKELKIKTEENTSPKDELKEKFKQYVIAEKYHVYVGKDSSNNDMLTTKFAKQNDYWFHARSVPGSHVVLRVENSKEPVPKDVLKKAASLAAYHSKAKTAGMAPVSYTFKKYVVKKKGMEPGKVALMKEDVLIVKPEIPAGCEYISNE
jgi:predicted ribosome quality control (RQC) complex YloA/Tae2 family protein